MEGRDFSTTQIRVGAVLTTSMSAVIAAAADAADADAADADAADAAVVVVGAVS